MILGVDEFEVAVESRFRRPPPQQLDESPHDRTVEGLEYLGGGVVVAIDVTAHTGRSEQFHVVRAGEETDVVDLGGPRQEELDRPRREVALVVASECVVEGAVDLVEIEVRGGGAGGGPAGAAGVLVDGLDQVVDLLGREQPGPARIAGIDADIDDPDAVVGVEHVDRIRRTHRHPTLQVGRIASIQGVECQWGQGEVVDEVDASGDLELVEVVTVDLDEHLHVAVVAGSSQPVDEGERLGQHEARRTGAFDRVAHRIESHEGDSAAVELVEDADEVGPAELVLDVDVDLAVGERRPHQTAWCRRRT